ncbi:MAG: Exopolyphosphatase [Alphaproteobacteria bacterium MarineAlpha11_Bin1]|nr:MAG: Exopolyphosphatase [Alphaproteobacteria bacterium MarineAlpha11_Bin1]
MSASPPHHKNRPEKTGNNAVGRKDVDRKERLFAALDLGTNNCRLLIAQPEGCGFRVIDGFSRVVRLGEGVGEAGTLSEAAIERTIDALKICANKISRRRVSNGRYVATQAARSARNSDYFIRRVKDETGIEMEIISSREEAELTLTGCFSLLEPSYEYVLMFDVGGGSAEFVWARILKMGGAQILGWTSLPCGVVTLTETHGSKEFAPLEYKSLVSSVVEIVRPFDLEFGISDNIARGRVQMVGTAGTVTTVAGLDMCLARYDRSRVDGSWLSFDSVGRISQALSTQSYDERAANPCIGHNRADLVVAGCAVLEAVCRIWPAGRLRVADRGVREGLLSVMSGQSKATCDGAATFAAE